MARMKIVWCVVLILFAAAVLIVGCSSTTAPNNQTPAPTTAEKEKPKGKPAEFFGDKSAKVTVAAFYPATAGHIPTLNYVKSLAEKFPNKLYISIYDTQNEDSMAEYEKTGLSCAGVLVNGKFSWDVLRDGKKEVVTFTKRIDDFWSGEDLDAVVQSQLEDPTKTPVVPSAKNATDTKSASEGK